MTESTLHDTHRYVKELTNAGLAEPIAQLIADRETRLLESNLATKTDIANVQHDIELLRKDTKALVLESKNELIKWFVVLTASLVFAGIGILVQVLINSLN